MASDPVTTRWEYLVMRRPTRGDTGLEAALSDAGEAGWELVSVTSQEGGPVTLYFKRRRGNG